MNEHYQQEKQKAKDYLNPLRLWLAAEHSIERKDYNYKKLYEQAKFVNQASFYVPPQMMNLTWERVSVRPDGRLEYLDSMTMVQPPLGNETTVAVQTVNGTEYLSGQFFEYDHLPGGVLYVPPSSSKRSASRALNFTRLGQINQISLL